MVLFVLIGIMCAAGAGLATFQAALNLYLAAMKRKSRLAEIGNALLKLGWGAVNGVLLYGELITPPSTRFILVTPTTLSLILGFAAATVGLILLMHPVINRVVSMEAENNRLSGHQES